MEPRTWILRGLIAPFSDGKAKVRSKRGTMEVEAEFGNLQTPTAFGDEYLTYVLWAISPEGRAVNLGEILVGDNDRSKLTATTDLQAFALIVTAEPYFAVQQPSNVVVLENIVTADTKGTSEAVNAKYELMERGGYHSHRLQVRPCGSECQSSFGVLRGAERTAHRQIRRRRDNMRAKATSTLSS